jgi:hypothetical protein
VIPEHRGLAALAHDLSAGLGVGVVSDDVAQAENLVAPLFVEALERRGEPFEVGAGEVLAAR